MMNPLSTQETESMRALQKSFGRNSRKANDITIFEVCELRAGAIGKLLSAAQAPTPPACPPLTPPPAVHPVDWEGKVELRVNHRTQQGVVMAIYGDQVCVKSSRIGGLSIFRLKEIEAPLDNFDKMAEKILDARYNGPANYSNCQRMAAILRELHAKEDLFQVKGVARA